MESYVNTDIEVQYQRIVKCNLANSGGYENKLSFDDTEVVVDYFIQHSEDDIKDHKVSMMVAVYREGENMENAKNGVRIIAQGKYYITEDIDDKNELYKKMKYGSVSNLLSFVRGAIYNLTALSFDNPYSLPSINLIKLREKVESINRNERTKRKVTKKKDINKSKK